MAPQTKPKQPLPFPEKAMLDCGAILGKRGAGKSTTARFLLEHEVDIGHRCCFIDPMGDAAGVRLNPDKTPSRFQNVMIFGGERGDIPIKDSDGGRVARAVGTTDISCIVDLSQMVQAEQLRFMAGFADKLYDDIKNPVTLFVDEAHIFAPQERGEASALLLNRMNRLNSQGRKRGIFLWLMTQRPARINKNIIAGTETLIAMRMTMPRDIDAIQEWLEAQDPAKAKELRPQLSKLSAGEAFVWIPGADFLERIQFPMHSTLDTGKTPLHGETVGGVVLPKVDVSQLADLFGGLTEGDPRDDRIEALEAENKGLRDQIRDALDRAAKEKAKAAAAIDAMVDVQHRIGATMGSPKIHPIPPGEYFEDFVWIRDTDGEVRPYLKQGDNGHHVRAAFQRMDRARVPTQPSPKNRKV